MWDVWLTKHFYIICLHLNLHLILIIALGEASRKVLPPTHRRRRLQL